MSDRIEPEDIKLLRQFEKNRHTIDAMTKVWEVIQENLRNPWKQNDRRAPRDKGGR
jgi:hypothetical protein